MTENLQPLCGRVFIEPLLREEFSRGGIVIPDSARHPQKVGKVIAVGAGVRTKSGEIVPASVKVGDTIVYVWNSVREIPIVGHDTLYVLNEEDILGVVDMTMVPVLPVSGKPEETVDGK